MRLAVVIRRCMESGDVLISGFRYPSVVTAASVGLLVRILAWSGVLGTSSVLIDEYSISFCEILGVVR